MRAGCPWSGGTVFCLPGNIVNEIQNPSVWEVGRTCYPPLRNIVSVSFLCPYLFRYFLEYFACLTKKEYLGRQESQPCSWSTKAPPPPLQSEEQRITIESRLVFGQLVELVLQLNVVWRFEI